MTDSDVEMVIENLEPPTMDEVFGSLAESEDEYNSWRYKVHTCFCRSEDCVSCAVRDCPHHEPAHYHHDGCPECTRAVIEAAADIPIGTIQVGIIVNGVPYVLPVSR